MRAIYRYGKLSRPTLVGGIQYKGAKDARTGFAIGNEIHMMFGTDNNQTVGVPSVFDTCEKSTDGGRTWTNYVAPMLKRNECQSFVIGNSAFLFGGTIGGYVPTSQNPSGGKFANTRYLADAWEYTVAGGFRKITDTMTDFNAGFAYEAFEEDGVVYLFQGDSVNEDITTGKILKSTSFVPGATSITWQEHGKMPLPYVGKGRFSVCSWKGVWYLVGGAGDSDKRQFWRSKDKGQTWELIREDVIFDPRWPEIKACDDFMVFQRGAPANNPIGERGTYIIDDPVTLEFKRLEYEREGTHASDLFPSADGKKIYVGGGNMHTTFGVIEELVGKVM